MWKWIEHTLEDSEDFNFLFVAGHYMTIDSRGIYDRLVIVLIAQIPCMPYTVWFIHYVSFSIQDAWLENCFPYWKNTMSKAEILGRE